MHHIIGGFIVGAAVGQTSRKLVWRPLLRNVIKGGIVVAREASSATATLRQQAVSIYEEAKAELDQQTAKAPEA